MQNWDHVQFVFSNLNQMPKDSHNTDFSRVKPWVLDGKCVSYPLHPFLFGGSDVYSSGAFLRQTILFTAYETPEIRALFNKSLKNVAGKVRTENFWPPLQVPEGVEPVSILPESCIILPITVTRTLFASTVQTRRMNSTSGLTTSSNT